MPAHLPLDGRVHSTLLRELIARGHAPETEALAAQLDVTPAEVEASLSRLDANHGLVLHPGTSRVWVAHPFSLSPTLHWVAGRRHGWWAPCVWCAFGVAQLVGEDVLIHSRIGGEAEALVLHARDGRLEETGLFAHFPAPPRHAWDNVHHFCASLLPFRSEPALREWATRHGLGLGAALRLETLWALARHWYGGHLREDWRKHTVTEAQAIFEQVGLRGDFWDLGNTRSERF